MQQDLKHQHLMEEKKRIEARKARLLKLNLDLVRESMTKDYYDKYETDKSLLDKYQLQGLVNKYKAFTTPRRIPTFFMVSDCS